jgi:hypothetical protein
MSKRIAMAAAAVAAAVAVPLAAASTAQASAWHFQAAYPSYAACEQAGHDGAALWGPLFVCSPGQTDSTGRQWYNLMVH